VNYLSGFLGNRYQGLDLRFSLSAITPAGSLAINPRSIELGPPNRYMTFAYSTNHNMVYMTGTNAIYAYAVAGTGALHTVAAATNAAPVAVDDALHVLYVARTDGAIEVCGLNSNGVPVSSNAVVATGIKPIAALCVNPQTHHLYIFGDGGPAGPVPNPSTPPAQRMIQVPESYVGEAAVDAARHRLYAARSYNANSNVLVWTLAPGGTLSNTTPGGMPMVSRRHQPSPKLPGDRARRSAPQPVVPWRRLGDLLRAGRVIVYTLDANGDPAGLPRRMSTDNAMLSVNAIELANDRASLYDAGWATAASSCERSTGPVNRRAIRWDGRSVTMENSHCG